MLVLVAGGLSACGKSKDARQYEAAKCEAWGGAVGNDMPVSGHPTLFGITFDEAPMNPGESEAWMALGNTYGGSNPPLGGDEMKAATREGVALYQTEVQNNDISGAMAFDKECIDNYYALTSN
jgi:hypothetical protein